MVITIITDVVSGLLLLFAVLLAGALVYAELGTAVPLSGGEHAYLLYTFNPKKKKGGIGRVPAFLYDWMGLLIIRPTMFAIISLAFGLYVVKPFFPDCSPPQLLVKMVTAVGMCE